MADRGSMHWDRSPAELTARFEVLTAKVPGLTRRKMFGELAGFVNGNLVTGLHAGRWFVRLSAADQEAARTLDGSGPFEPMPGRPMTGYTVLPPSIVEDDRAIADWVDRAVVFGGTLKPKA